MVRSLDVEDALVYDEETGEVLYEGELSKEIAKKIGSKRESILSSQDITLDISSLDTPQKALSYKKSVEGGGVVYKPIVEGLDAVILEATLDYPQLRVFVYIGSKVVYNNLCYVQIKDIGEVLGITASTVSRAISALEGGGWIAERFRNTFGVGSRVYAISPVYFWCGHFGVRRNTIQNVLKSGKL